jgi:hypothetical protein
MKRRHADDPEELQAPASKRLRLDHEVDEMELA